MRPLLCGLYRAWRLQCCCLRGTVVRKYIHKNVKYAGLIILYMHVGLYQSAVGSPMHMASQCSFVTKLFSLPPQPVKMNGMQERVNGL